MHGHSLWGIITGLTSIACLVSSQLTTTNIPTANCSSINTTECTACSPGTYPNNGVESCLCCSSGACVNQTDCLLCPSGYYQPKSDQESCLPCPQGFYSNTSGRVECQSCQPGSFSNESASVLCMPCEKGFSSFDQNATQCRPCAPGSFCNTTGCSSCASCPPGEESLSYGLEECTPCLPGMYKGPGDPICVFCPNGYYQVESGAARCDQCPEGHYCPTPDISPIHCPDDAFCPPGTTAPSYCMETFLQKSGDFCVLAPLTIVLIAFCVSMPFIGVVYAVRKRRPEPDTTVLPVNPKSPLLTRPYSSPSTYGMSPETDPVYAGW